MTRLIHNSGLPLCSAPQQLPVICRKCCSTALAVLKFPLFAPKVLRNASLALCTRWETLSSRAVRRKAASYTHLLVWYRRILWYCDCGCRSIAVSTTAPWATKFMLMAHQQQVMPMDHSLLSVQKTGGSMLKHGAL